MENLRERMKQHARAYNRFLTYEWLESKTNDELLCSVHPVDREGFEKELRELDKL